MLNIFKMDMHRLKHSKVFYVSIVFITIMAIAIVMSGMSTTMDAVMGADVPIASDGDAFMTGMMGAGIIFILLSIILSIFVCGDYSGGFANNIFTAHSNAWDYIGGKMLSMATISGFLLLLYTVESTISLSFFGYGVALSGGVAGLVIFIFEKWILSCALSSVTLLITVFTRNVAWGIVGGFLVATGGLTMGIAMLAGLFGFDWLTVIFSVTISGSSQICTLMFDGLILLRVVLASVVWIVVSCLASRKVLLAKDI